MLKPQKRQKPNRSAASLTDGIDLIHKDDAWLVIPGIVEHLSDQPGTLTNVLVHDGAGNHLQHRKTDRQTTSAD